MRFTPTISMLAKAAAAAALVFAGAADATANDSKSAHLYGKAASPLSEKIDYRLAQAAQTAQKSGSAATLRAPKGSAMRQLGDGILVEAILNSWPADPEATFALPGVRIAGLAPDFQRATLVAGTAESLEALAALPEVRLVEPVFGYQTHAGSVESRARFAMNADEGSFLYGLDGSGTAIGIISDSFARTSGVRDFNTSPGAGQPGTLRGARNQDSGDLPATVTLLDDFIDPSEFVDPDQSPPSPSDEGAAMGELIFDVAPGAAQIFHEGITSQSVFAQGIADLVAAGADVVVDDIGYFTEPIYQQGVIAQAAQEAVSQGSVYFSAAGNSGNVGVRNLYRDANPSVDDTEFPPTGNDFHLWTNDTPYLALTVGPREVVTVVLQWNQPFANLSAPETTRDETKPDDDDGQATQPGSQIDLDLYTVLNPTVNSVRGTISDDDAFISTAPQGTTGNPKGNAFEILSIINEERTPVTYYLVVEHHRGRQDFLPQDPSRALEMRLLVFGSDFVLVGIGGDDAASGGPTIFGHTAAPEVISVGAVPWYDTPAYNLFLGPTPQIDAEEFTGLGGNFTFLFDPQGNLNVVETRKPDLAAPNGNNTTFFPPGSDLFLNGYDGEPDGLPNFFGTSAAAPNAAAVALLLLEYARKNDVVITPAIIRDILQDTARDVTGRRAAVGWDDVTGYGLVDARAALDELARRSGLSTPTPSPTPVGPFLPGGEITPTPDGTPDPDAPIPPPAQRVTFTFENDISGGWEFQTINDAAFTAPDGKIENGLMIGEFTDNQSNFGLFRSPLFRVGQATSFSEFGLNGATGRGSLYRASYRVTSSLTPEQIRQVPSLRFRASTTDFSYTSEYQVSSSGQQTDFPPTIDRNRTYRHYFGLPEGFTSFRLYVDLLNFGGSDSPDALIFVDDVVVDAIGVASLGLGLQERVYNLKSNSEQWIRTSAESPASLEALLATFSLPGFAETEDGLRIGPALGGGNPPYFGYWRSPNNDPAAVVMDDSRIYRARFTVSTNATLSERTTVPTFRLRMNESTLNNSALLNINSSNSSSPVPAAQETMMYELFFEGREELFIPQGRRQEPIRPTLRFAFDYIFSGDQSNNPDILVTLEELRVDSYQKPVF